MLYHTWKDKDVGHPLNTALTLQFFFFFFFVTDPPSTKFTITYTSSYIYIYIYIFYITCQTSNLNLYSLDFLFFSKGLRSCAIFRVLCNCTNPIHSFNPMTPYFDTSLGHVGNSCAHSRFHFNFPFLNFTKTFSPLSHFNLALSITLPNAPLSQHPRLLSTSPSTPSSPFPAYPTQMDNQKQRKNGAI